MASIPLKSICTAAALLACGWAGQAAADDLLPAPFRGEANTTFQAWEFTTPNLGPPDGECPPVNPFIPPPTASASGPTVYLPQFAGMNGVICIVNAGDSLDFQIGNMPAPFPPFVKTVWVQVVFHPHAGSDIDVTVSDPAGNIAMPNGSVDLPVPGHPAWIHRTMSFCFFGCPPEETVSVTSIGDHVDVAQVITETLCQPELCEAPLPPAMPGDYDGDGIPDDQDNAPGVSNPNQLDCDGDGIGNVSDLWSICLAGTPLENEPCGTDQNGGCNAIPTAFEPLACGGAVCGTAWADAGVRDTDWYEINLPDSDGDGLAELTVTLCSALPTTCFLFNDDCANLMTLAQTEANADLLGTFTECLPAPATYYIFVATGTLAGGIFDGYPCGTPLSNQYSLTADCFEPCNTPCGDPAAGQCCIDNGTPGCADAACCQAVCAVDPFCCNTTWDAICADQANQICCPWDLNADCVVDFTDMLILRQSWGPCPGCAADFNADGVVNTQDQLQLRMNAGPCP